ncbi:unnamed protein product [Calypogeia fissa]
MDLLAGLYDESTLDLVVPKLPWRAFYVLSCVRRRSWKRVVWSGEVYEARIRSGSTETLVATVATERLDGDHICLTGRKTSANMHEPRANLAFAVKDGKNFVFDGTHGGSEVYNPQENTWSLITPRLSRRVDHEVATVGEELKLYGGRFLREDSDDERGRPSPSVLEDYHPAEDKWRVGDAVGDKFSKGMVFSQGKFHLRMALTSMTTIQKHGHICIQIPLMLLGQRKLKTNFVLRQFDPATTKIRRSCLIEEEILQ